jgi:hypothetical protein
MSTSLRSGRLIKGLNRKAGYIPGKKVLPSVVWVVIEIDRQADNWNYFLFLLPLFCPGVTPFPGAFFVRWLPLRIR